jgi:hypothetical protein
VIAPSPLALETERDLVAPRTFTLSSGQRVELRAPVVLFAPHYRVLSWPRPGDGQAPRVAMPAEIDEMFALAHGIARERGRTIFGDAECFAVLFNGARAARMPWPHFHLIPARSPSERRFVLLCLMLKRISRRLLRSLPRPLRERLLHA